MAFPVNNKPLVPGAPSSSAARPATPATPTGPAPLAVPTDKYEVVSGDTVWKIANDHGSDVNTVATDNQLADPGKIFVGQKLLLRDTVLLNIEPGDTLESLAHQYGTPVAELAAANKLEPGAALTPGKQLTLPGATFYTVVAGDTLSGISRKFGTSVDAIALANEITNPNLIQVGQKLVVASGAQPQPPPAPRPQDDPAVMKDHRDWVQYGTVPNGTLTVNGMSPNDVKQGQTGDCYLLAAMSALAQTDPQVLQNALRQNPDGTFTATFQETEYVPSNPDDPDSEWVYQSTPVEVHLDSDLPLASGNLQYAQGETPSELWVPLLEKAFAKWKGGFEEIGNGGWPDQAFTALTGKENAGIYLYGEPGQIPEGLFQQMQDASAAGHPMVTASKLAEETSGTGIEGSHAYSVTGVSEREGKQYVQLRNPWGHGEAGSDGNDDGNFEVPLADFAKAFHQVSVSTV